MVVRLLQNIWALRFFNSVAISPRSLMLIAQLSDNAEKARAMVMHLLRALPEERPASPIDTCLDYALITAPHVRDPKLLAKLDAVAGRALDK